MEMHERAPEVLDFLVTVAFPKPRSVKIKISLHCVKLMVSL